IGDQAHKLIRADGYDSPEFFLSPNVGEPLKPLVKIISGGELSRFMLAVKVITSDSEGAGALIFDEVDAGISGIIGQAVAKKLAKIANSHQVLCVTHLPQIASMADTHFRIEKSEKNGRTTTSLIPLDRGGMIDEIARLSGAKNISTEAQSNAKQMKDWSDKYKSQGQ
ncbi:MAG: DNA repair protein RecN, partial [Firmicutes bacterium]|nr:DNA repair protein RecN [Bacillota bacterium]